MENRDFLNGKQYPYGYRQWLWRICIEYDFKDKDINTAYRQLDTDAWLDYFLEGHTPKSAVREDNSHA